MMLKVGRSRALLMVMCLRCGKFEQFFILMLLWMVVFMLGVHGNWLFSVSHFITVLQLVSLAISVELAQFVWVIGF